MSGCSEYEADLVAFVDGETGPKRSAAIERHVAGCPACRAALDEIERVGDLLSAMPAIAPSAATMARLSALALRAASDPRKRRERRADRDGIISGASIGYHYVKFQLGRRLSLRIVGAVAAALVLHALAFAALRAFRTPRDESNLSAPSPIVVALPAPRRVAAVLETVGPAPVADAEPLPEAELADPFALVSYRDSVARQTEMSNTRSVFRLDASVRLDPYARSRAFATLGDLAGVEKGIDSGLAFLAAPPSAADGAPAALGREAAAALATLAFVGRGSSDAFGPHRDACARETAALVSMFEPSRLGREADDALTRAFALWALAENSALSDWRRGAEAVARAVDRFEIEQRADGGWDRRRTGRDGESDPFVSATVASALAIASRSGFSVPANVTTAFVERFAAPRLRAIAEGVGSDNGRDAAADASLLLAFELLRGLDERLVPPAGCAAAVEHLLVDRLAAPRVDLLLGEHALLALQLGTSSEGARALHGTVTRRLLAAQGADGSFDSARFDLARLGVADRRTATALAVLILEIPCRYRSRN